MTALQGAFGTGRLPRFALEGWAGACSIPANADHCAGPEAGASTAQNVAPRLLKSDNTGDEIRADVLTALLGKRSWHAAAGERAVGRRNDRELGRRPDDETFVAGRDGGVAV